jgi:hypothetical protein
MNKNMRTSIISGLTLTLALGCSSSPLSAHESFSQQANTLDTNRETIASEVSHTKQTSPPDFNDYPATESFSGAPAPVDLSSDPDARRFRTVLREGAQTGPNFAGKYTVVTWGCGTSCQSVAIVDAETGSVYMPGIVAEAGVKHKLDSRLLVVNPPENTPGNRPDWMETSYYVWDGTELTEVSTSSSSSSRKEEVDDWTDTFFYAVHPDMKGRSIDPAQELYVREWNALRGVVKNWVGWIESNCGTASSDQDQASVDNVSVRDKLADAVFYARHPELNGREIRSGETALANEWKSIHDRISEVLFSGFC